VDLISRMRSSRVCRRSSSVTGLSIISSKPRLYSGEMSSWAGLRTFDNERFALAVVYSFMREQVPHIEQIARRSECSEDLASVQVREADDGISANPNSVSTRARSAAWEARIRMSVSIFTPKAFSMRERRVRLRTRVLVEPGVALASQSFALLRACSCSRACSDV
jgi:hypothetical protein